ncbi:MAG: 50S ribosomal protein L11 methyltransferase [Paludibacter sp.]|nr:50S ribosomal protein L11 methyltransferase [Bacteroidales bacterium]MCM1069965.1 50S ribosomal protein L11 methyltransferase [Prevotella sp.]MCM1354549.1 50S ribosomal protein L11 methyltransferase [Bacteroides sp.]MCM1443560.1 50S ribosomal protein L11 methyltransferase [Muribaculum sp.]MCM1482632.1 50S ribosomal protein L11 methyltransferase [Paludibacter sp.]
MQYSKATFRFCNTEEFVADVLTATLADIGFETFLNPTADTLEAYVPNRLLNTDTLTDLVNNFPYSGITLVDIVPCEDKNWNEEWEKHYFEPIVIGEQCVIHSSFHRNLPNACYDIVIDPKMAFGTGHHATTSLMLEALLEMDLQEKSLLDMGCGTAVLAILATMRGATPVTAIDIDNWCTENAEENCKLNAIQGMEILLGDAKLLQGRAFDVILANINRNILLMDMPHYADCLPQGGSLLMSGFYTEDIPVLEAKAGELGLTLQKQRTKDNWAMITLQK